MAIYKVTKICESCHSAFRIATWKSQQRFCSKSCARRWRHRDRDDIARFWKYVNLGPILECWEWTGAKSSDGYGSFGIYVEGHQKAIGTHRFAWFATNGAIPDEMSVLHACDNPACCNPHHLFLGTQQDNIGDMVTKSRAAKKLTVEVVTQIFRAAGTCKSIANRFGVCPMTVSHIKTRKTWKHLNL